MPAPLPAKRVLILNNLPSPYLTPLFQLVRQQAAWDVQVKYVTRWSKSVGWTEAQALQWNIAEAEILENPGSWAQRLGGAQLAAGWNLLLFLLSYRPDFLLIYGYTRLPQLLALAWAVLLGVPFAMAGDANFYTDHTRGLKRRAKAVWLRFVAWRAALIFSVGQACTKFWLNYGASAARIHQTGFAVDNDYFATASTAQQPHAQAERARRQWDGKMVLLYVGRLIERKQVHLLIDAVAQLPAAQVALLIAGDGSERAALEQRASARQLDCEFVGSLNQAELPLYYALADVLVLPARAEPWGLVINEAMASGLAVVAHQHCGAAIDLVDERNGALLQTYEVDELVGALRQLLDDPPRLRARQNSSRHKISSWTFQAGAQVIIQAITARFERAA